MLDRIPCFEKDLAHIKDSSKSFKDDSYSFTSDLQVRIDKLNLSDSALAKRCHVSHTTVYKWKSSKAIPKGRERFKELGMALDMDEDSLNTFLMRNGCHRLYVKNLRDINARILLREKANDPNLFPDLVKDYRELCEHREQVLEQERLVAYSDRALIRTTTMSMDFKKTEQIEQINDWFNKYRLQFSSSAKQELPNPNLAKFLFLHLGDKDVRELADNESLPSVLRNLLYSIYNGKGVPVDGLREKLIALGLCANMTSEEIDRMLKWTHLRPLSEPSSSLDNAIFEALCCAHYNYPPFELENIQRILTRLDRMLNENEFLKKMLSMYSQDAKQMASELERYLKAPNKAFEEHYYTPKVSRGVRDYLHDLLDALVEEGYLEARDILTRLDRMLNENEFSKEMLSMYSQNAKQMASELERYLKAPNKAFEEHYTFKVNRGVRDYVHDLLDALVEEGYLEAGETEDFLKMISRKNFSYSLRFALLRAGQEAEYAHYINPGIEFWLLGILKLSELSAKDAFLLPDSDLKTIDEDIAALKIKMDEYGIDPGTLYKNLRNLLRDRTKNDTKKADKKVDKKAAKKTDEIIDVVIDRYLKHSTNTAKRRGKKEVWAIDLLGAILEEPTDTFKEFLSFNSRRNNTPSETAESIRGNENKESSGPSPEPLTPEEFDRICNLFEKHYDLDVTFSPVFSTALLL